MTEARFDVLCMGNAIVDVLTTVPDTFLSQNGLNKGAMTLIDANRAEELYGLMGPAIERSGGSVANSAAGVGALGGRCAYVGKVANDQLGEIFRHDVQSLGIHFETGPLLGGAPTARSFIFVTPDAERTMQTFLGACTELTPEDVPEDLPASAKFSYLEGYLWDKPQAKAALSKAARIARAAGREVALSLSDQFCVDRHRDEFRTLINDHITVLIGNEDEVKSLVEVDSIEAALPLLRPMAGMIAITRSDRPTLVLRGEETVEVPVPAVAKVVDTTGAGDMFAAGFLWGLTNDLPLAKCARAGQVCAGEVISHIGPRPDADIRAMVRAERGL
ncbi:adenosine kinase [Radicibacter daui]|uniref:adenosine kinase n=1 Tax=Radicibacter daui TaxID=3064829 RepID=UPI004046F01F